MNYITNCSICQLSKFSKQFLYEKLKSISFSKKSLSELSFDFIIKLSMIIIENNVILIVTNRFSKYIKIVFDKKLFSTVE